MAILAVLKISQMHRRKLGESQLAVDHRVLNPNPQEELFLRMGGASLARNGRPYFVRCRWRPGRRQRPRPR